MPILIKDFSWSETETHVTLTIPLRGVRPNKADIFSSNLYIKVNFPPYLFEAHLFAPVLEEQCSARVGNGAVVFNLVKESPAIWGRLVCEEESRDKMTLIRQEAIEHGHLKYKEEAKEKARKKREEEKFAIKQQMKLEEEEKDRIEKEKQDERDKATSELESWKKAPPSAPPTRSVRKDVWTGKEEQPLPPPRAGGNITITFTPRPFTNAARESKVAEEEEWLAKMAAARKIKQPDNKKDNKRKGEEEEEGESINERNPEFLKDRGNEFFKTGNFEAAINVFTQALKLNHLLPSLYANRAACYLSTGNTEACISDCCKALELYYPVVPANVSSRAKVLARRGTAYAKEGDLDLALQDYDTAAKLEPKNSSLQEDYQNLKKHIMSLKI